MSESPQADQILQGERARRPRWPGVARLPRWFRGQELDVLDVRERHRLYLQTAAAQPGTPWFAWAMLLVWTPKGFENIVSDHHRWLWIGCLALYALGAAGALLLRRRNILNTARRNLRESADWPLRRQARLGD